MTPPPLGRPTRSRFRVGLGALMVAVGAAGVFLGGVAAGIRWEASRRPAPATAPKGPGPAPSAPAVTPGVVTWDARGNGAAYGHYTDRRGVTHRGASIFITKSGSIITD